MIPSIASWIGLFSSLISFHISTNVELENGARLVFRLQHPDGVCSVLFWPEKEAIVTGCWDDSIRFWNVRTGKMDREWKAHQAGVTALARSPKGALASAGLNCSVQVWADDKPAKIGRFHTRNATNSLAFSPDGTLLFSAAWRNAYLWELPRGRLTIDSYDYSPSAVAFSPTGKFLAMGTASGLVLLLDAPFAKIPDPPEGKGVTLLDKTTKVRRDDGLHVGNAFAIYSLAFSPDGRTLAAFGEISDLILWEVLTGKERRRLKTEKAVGFSVAFAPNGRVLATGEGWGFDLKGYPGGDRTTGHNNKEEAECNFTRLWDIRSGKAICRLARHETGTRCLAFSPDGKLLATGSEDKSVLLWDVSAITQPPKSNAPETPLGDLESLWTSLKADDAAVAYDAILRLSDSPKQSTPFLRDKLRPVAAVEKTEVEKLLKKMDSDDFATRQEASQQLQELGEGADATLRDELSKQISLESRARINSAIDKWKGHNPNPEILGALRGVETLERIGSDDAIAVLEGLAKGLSSARLTQEAKGSLTRIREREKK